MHTGCPMHRVTRIPYAKQLAGGSYKLSEKARQRLKIIDWYQFKSAYFSMSKKRNAELTCRHFGIHRSYFNRWWTRYKCAGVYALEDKSRSVQRKKQTKYDMKLVSLIREIRKENPSWSAKKIRVILSWEKQEQYVPSIATIGRIIKKYHMFYRADIQARKKRRKRAGKTALQKIIQRFGKHISIVNDNGSENMGEAERWLTDENIRQYWCRANKPKDKPLIERFIGTLQTECLDYHCEPLDVQELQDIVDQWIFKYENQRAHEGLDFLTPKQFEATFYTQKHSPVSYLL